MSLLGSLGNLLGDVQRTVGHAEGRVLNNPMQSLSQLIHPVRSAAQALQQRGAPLNPFMQSAAQDYNYTPQFAHLARQVPATATGNHMPGQVVGAEAQYAPEANRIDFNRQATVNDSSPDYVLTHELLHAQYQRMSPQQQQSFLQMANQSITPQQRAFLTTQLNSPTYGHYKLPTDLTKVPFHIATEIHSYLPEAVDWGMKTGHMPPTQTAYYAKYMNPNAITSPSQYGTNAQKAAQIATATGMTNRLPQLPQPAGGPHVAVTTYGPHYWPDLQVRPPAPSPYGLQGAWRQPQPTAFDPMGRIGYNNLQAPGNTDEPQWNQGSFVNPNQVRF